MSVAAQKLHLSQSSVSGMLARLREHYGDQLLDYRVGIWSEQCQTARKRDPVSASKRDPLFEIRQTVVGSALRWVRWRSGVARPEAHPAQVRSEARVRVAVNCGF
ncbi:MAG: LysR family transcriptional regulator [Sphingobium sp.]